MELLTQLGTYIVSSIVGVGTLLSSLVYPPTTPIAFDATLQTVPGYEATANRIPQILIDNTSYQQAALADSQGLVASSPADAPETALVNIFCTYRTDEVIRYTTGSGFFITPTGVVLTNAHVAQFLLLESVSNTGTTECVVRRGNPAIPAYEADLLYISPAWVQEHASLIAEAAPKGTGERDYALLYLTTGVNNTPLPDSLPYINVDTELQSLTNVGNTVTIGGYPTTNTRQLVDGEALARQTATTTLKELYTFGSNYGDIYFLGGNTIGQQGLSGGPVLNTQAAAIGLIVTAGDDATQGVGSLNAITLSYIDRTIQEETGFSLAQTISGNLSYKSHIFTQTLVPFLATLLEREL